MPCPAIYPGLHRRQRRTTKRTQSAERIHDLRSTGSALGEHPPPPLDVVMAWSVDRLGRSLQDLCGFLSELHSLGIDLFLHQQGISTTTPAGKAMFQMMGVLSEFERSMIRERVNAGIARAKAGGKHCGRPFIDPQLEGRIRDALAAPGRPGLHKIAKQFGVGTGTVQRIAHAQTERNRFASYQVGFGERGGAGAGKRAEAKKTRPAGVYFPLAVWRARR